MDDVYTGLADHSTLAADRDGRMANMTRALQSSETRVRELSEENERLKKMVADLQAALRTRRSESEESGNSKQVCPDARRPMMEERILQYLGAMKTASTRAIGSVLGIGRKYARIYLDELLAAGLVSECAQQNPLSLGESHSLEKGSRSWELTENGQRYISLRGAGPESGAQGEESPAAMI
jgi:hypothetical protein